MNCADRCAIFLFAFASPVYALGPAEYVVAEEITGVVVEAEAGKPVPGAVVAMRFERNNTGHSGPHCFRSMAVETNQDGRFRFAPWQQEKTLANYAMGHVTAYKTGYVVPPPTFIKQSNRDVFGIALSDTIKIPKTDLRIELAPFKGDDNARADQLIPLVGQFNCRWQAQFDSALLLRRIREEIVSSPLADFKPNRGDDTTLLKWITAVISR